MLTELGKRINHLINTMLHVNTQKDGTDSPEVSLTHRHTWFWFWELAQETQCRPRPAWWAAHWSRTPCPGRGARFCNSWNPPAVGRSSSRLPCSTPPLGPQWARPHWWSWRWVESRGRLPPRRPAEVEQWERGALEGKSESHLSDTLLFCFKAAQRTPIIKIRKLWTCQEWSEENGFVEVIKKKHTGEDFHNVQICEINHLSNLSLLK